MQHQQLRYRTHRPVLHFADLRQFVQSNTEMLCFSIRRTAVAPISKLQVRYALRQASHRGDVIERQRVLRLAQRRDDLRCGDDRPHGRADAEKAEHDDPQGPAQPVPSKFERIWVGISMPNAQQRHMIWTRVLFEKCKLILPPGGFSLASEVHVDVATLSDALLKGVSGRACADGAVASGLRVLAR